MIKCFLIRGDYSHALDFIHRLGFKELPASISIFDSSEINMIKILKENRELGFYFLMAQAGIKRLVDSGYQTAEKCRVFFMHKNGILDRGTEYSVEVYEGGRFDDSKLKEFEKEEAVKRIENENEVNLNEFRLLAKEANIRASKLLLEIQEVMGEKDPVII
jgi:hypothetical protein